MDRVLAGRAVLVLEDEYFVAQRLAGFLRGAGAHLIGPFPDPDRAQVALNDARPDCAVLDINIDGRMQFRLADHLAQIGVPFVFSSGYERGVIPDRHRAAPLCQKPVQCAPLLAALAVLLA